MDDKNSSKYMDVELVDHTKLYMPYNIRKSALRLISVIPRGDLGGLGKIHIYDESFPEEQFGKYYPPGFRGELAEIDIYLNQTLGHMALISDENSHFQMLRNRIFLLTFGRIFLAEALYHEIGHHKFMAVNPREYKTSTDQEQDAKVYANRLLRKAFPFSLLCYPLTNMLYHLLFRKFIRNSEQFMQNKQIIDPGYLRSAGNMHLDKKEYEKAAKAFSRAIEIDPSDGHAYFGRGVALHQLGKYDTAIQDYTMGIKFCLDDPIAFYNRGLSYQALQEYERAISDLTRAIELEYRDKDVYVNRAFCYGELGKKEMAEGDLIEAGKKGK